jgi:hypothetical protein
MNPSLLSTARRHGSPRCCWSVRSSQYGTSRDRCYLDAQSLWLSAEGARPEQLLGFRKLNSGHLHAEYMSRFFILHLHFNGMSGGGIIFVNDHQGSRLTPPVPRSLGHTIAGGMEQEWGAS